MGLIFVGEGYPQKIFNFENFPNYGTLVYALNDWGLQYIKFSVLKLLVTLHM